MPPSRSTGRSLKTDATAPTRRRSYALPIVIAVLAALAVFVTALPPSLLLRFLPPNVRAEDLSGSIWHGAAGRVSYAGRNLGAVEWRLDPLGLLSWTAKLQVTGIHRGVEIAAVAAIDRHAANASLIQGGGPIEDLQDLGLAAGWRGTFHVSIDLLKTDFATLQAVHGTLTVADLAGAQVAHGADLGNYVLRLGDTPVDAASAIAGQISDDGGPLEVHGTITITPQQHNCLVSATLRERADAPAELRRDLADVASLRGRDAEGRIPIDVEFSF